ncbi:MAG: amino acid adenylation domain-containing protein [Janthinobacterium lividum]
MEVFELIKQLKKADVHLFVEAQELKVKARPGALPAALLAHLKTHKQALLLLLQGGPAAAETIAVAPLAADYPLSYGQQSIWTLSQDAQGSLAYHMPVVMQLPDEANAEQVQQAIQDLVGRHSILRTSFFEQADGSVRQRVEPAAHFGLQVLEVPALSAATLPGYLLAESMKAFGLDQAPLLRGTLLRSSGASYLLLTVHHIVCDGLSLDVLQQEMLCCYEARKKGEAPVLPALTTTYQDFAVWQHTSQQQGLWQVEEQYWKTLLQPTLPVIELKNNLKRPVVKTFAGERLRVELPRPVRTALQARCTQQQVSLFSGLLAGLQALIFRYTQKTDTILGTVTSGRSVESLQHLVGLFINTLPLRLRFEPTVTFEQLLAAQQQVLQDALAHQALPFQKMVELAGGKRDLSRSAIFDIMVIFNEHAPENHAAAAASAYSFLQEDLRTTSQFDLTIAFDAQPAGLAATLEFNTAIYDSAFISRLWEHFVQLLATLLAAPGDSITSCNYLPPTERRQQLQVFNDLQAYYQPEVTILDLIEKAATANAQQIALIGPAAQLTFQQVWQQVTALSVHLRTIVGPGQVVAVQLTRTEWLPIALLAVLHSGAAYLPLDLAYPQERIDYILQDSGCDLLITEEWFAAYQQQAPLASVPPAAPINGAALAYIIYTSGSTGKPKGVMISHQNMALFVQWALEEFATSPFEMVYAVTSHCFDLSVFELFFSLAAGKTVRMLPSGLHIADAIAADRGVLINTVPSVVQHLLKDSTFPWQHVAVLNMAGEAVPQHFKKALDYHAIEVRNLYGPSETTTYSTCYRFSDQEESITIGRPIRNTRVYVLDEFQQLVPTGLDGELYIAGAGVTLGYKGKAALTQERYLPDLLQPGQKMYKTGDLGHWGPDGQLVYTGRKDDQVKLRGFRIELGEIENALEQVTGVSKAVVQVRQSASKEAQLVAYVATAQAIPEEHLRHQLQQYLPAYMLPDAYVALPALPLTPNGKVDKAALPWEDSCLAPARPAAVAPRTTQETQLCALWREVLGEELQFGVADNFFEIGGNSLHAARLYSLLKQRLGLQTGIRFVLENTTIAAQAALLADHTPHQEIAIPLAPAQPTYPVSSFQAHLWLLSKNAEAAQAYHVPGGMHLRGPLDAPALRQAFGLLLERHELLRSVFEESATGEVRQRVLPLGQVSFQLPVVAAEAGPALEALVRQNEQAPFALSTELPIRATLVRLAPDHHCLLYCLHHIVCDGWALKLLEKEVMQAYLQWQGPGGAALPPLPIQYKDYIHWQSQQEFSKAEAYWKTKLAAPLPLLELPLDTQRPKQKTYRGRSTTHTLPAATVQPLKAAVLAANTTVFTGLLATLHLLLWRYSGQSDQVLGVAVAGREHSQLQDQIGPYLNTLPLRSQVRGTDTFAQVLAQVRQSLLEAYEHQHYAFAQIVDLVAAPLERGRSPLFDVLVVYQNQASAGIGGPAAGLAPAGITVAPLPERSFSVSPLDMTFIFQDTAQGIELRAEYNADLYSEAYMQRLLANYAHLLQALAQQPEQAIGSQDFMAPAERHWLATTVNHDVRPYPDASLVALFEAQAAATPAHTALIAGASQLTYHALNQQANQFANYLRLRHAVGPGTNVCLQMHRSEQLLVAMLGILKAGCAYVPIDHSYPTERKQYILADSACALTVDDACFGDFRAGQAQYASQNLALPIAPEQLCYVIYTSGSTGNPKGVMVRHRNVVPLVKNTSYLAIQPTDVLLQWSNFAFDGAVFDIFGALLNGATLVLLASSEVASLDAIKARIYEHQVTVMFITTALFNLVVDADITTFRPLRKLLFGGELVSKHHVRRAVEYLGRGRLLHMYGPTETTVYATFHAVDEVLEADLTVPIGVPLTNDTVYILDEALQLLPRGASGEICLGGAGVSQGYLNDADKTAAKFVPNPFKAGELLYRTGDLGRWQENGAVAFMGRIDFQVKIRGHRVELAEIEYYLSLWDEITDGVVRLNEDAQGDKYLCAYVVGAIRDEQALRAYLLQTLPDYMVPTCFVSLAKLPINANGKVDRQALPIPSSTSPAPKTARVAPRTSVEQQLWHLWEKVLGKSDFGITEKFSELGGHSLKASRLLAEIRKTLQVNVALAQLLNSSIEEQAAQLTRAESVAFQPIARAPRQPSYPLSTQQLGIFAADWQHSGSEYLISGGLSLRGELQPEHFRAAAALLLDQHDILRTVYRPDATGEIRQWVLPSITAAHVWAYHDLSGLAAPAEVMAQHCQAIGQTVMDLQAGPLFKLVLFKQAPNEYALMYFLHHIVSDGWGLDVLREELLSAYLLSLEGKQAVQSEIQYKDYAAWQQQELGAGSLLRYEQYWRDQFQREPEFLTLPFVAATDAFADADAETGVVTAAVAAPLLQGMRRLAAATNSSVFSVALTGLNLLLHSYTAQHDITIRSPFAGRQHADLDRVIGCFADSVLLRTYLHSHHSLQELLQEVHAVVADTYQYQFYPTTMLHELLQQMHGLDMSDLTRVSINYLNLNSRDSRRENTALGTAQLEIGVLPEQNTKSKYDINIVFNEDQEKLVLHVEYNTRKTDLVIAQELHSRLQEIIQKLIEFPTMLLADFAAAYQVSALPALHELAMQEVDDEF